jgi:hypothetical protein
LAQNLSDSTPERIALLEIINHASVGVAAFADDLCQTNTVPHAGAMRIVPLIGQ